MGYLKCSKAAQNQIKGGRWRGWRLAGDPHALHAASCACGGLQRCRSRRTLRACLPLPAAGKFNSLFASGLKAYMFGRS